MAQTITINDPSDNSGARVIAGVLQTSAVISGNVTATNPSVSPTGAPVPGNATAIAFQNAGGNLTIPSATNPLPITGNIAASNPSVSTTGTPVPGNATYIGAINAGGNLTGVLQGNNTAANSLSVVLATNQATISTNANITGGNVTVTGNVVVPANISVQVTNTPTDNITQFGGSNVVTGTGASGAGIPRVTISNDSSLAANQTVQVTNTVPVTLPANITANVTTVPANMSVNLLQVGSAAYALGNQTAANSMPVVIATNQGSVPVTPAANSTVNLTQLSGTTITAGNSTAANSIPVVIATNQGAVPVTVASTTITGNVTVVGPVAGNATVAGNPVQTAYRAVSAEVVPNGNNTVIQPVTDLVGKTINLPYANKENMLRGNATIANTTAVAITGFGAQGAAFKIYITSVQAFRTDAGATLVYLTLNDSNNTSIPLPPNGGASVPYPIPLVIAANTGGNVTLSANITSALFFCQGYFGT